jgi:hypothetical protein
LPAGISKNERRRIPDERSPVPDACGDRAAARSELNGARMDLTALLHHYGYALIFLGTLAEGESLLVLGGIFAHRGYLDLTGVIITA